MCSLLIINVVSYLCFRLSYENIFKIQNLFFINVFILVLIQMCSIEKLSKNCINVTYVYYRQVKSYFFLIKNIYSLNNCGIYGLLHSLPSLYTSVRRIKKQEVERGSNFNCEMTFKFCVTGWEK